GSGALTLTAMDPPSNSRTTNVLYAVLLALAALLAWSARGANSDFFMALGGGEDVVAGRLAKPDTWSYITAGRVWINQSWLPHWALYCLWQIGGPPSAVAARSVLLGAVVLGMLAWIRAHGISWPAACLAVALFLLVCRYYFYFALRGNLVTIAILPWL